MKKIYFFILLWVSAMMVCAEGTKELRPTAANDGSLHIGMMNNTYTPFGVYDAPVENQIRVSVASTDETIYLGLGGVDNNDIRPFRVKSPSGQIVYTSDIPRNGDEGFIASYNQAVAGPGEIGNANGYNAIAIDPVEIGDYVIEFQGGRDFVIPLFDVTVADVANQPIPGRLHSLGWQIDTGSYSNPFEGIVYPYDPKGVTYEVDFNGMQPFLFVINFNSKGTGDSGNFEEDRISKIGYYTFPEYAVFLNPPDPVLYPNTDQEVVFNGEVTNTDCITAEYCLNFTTNVEGVIDGFIDINGDDVYSSSLDVYFNHEFEQGGSTCIPWDGKDANGNIVTDDDLKVIASFGFGVTHLPLFDAEHNRNGYIVRIVRPTGVGQPLLYWDDSRITQGSTLGDSKVNLNGCNPVLSNGCHTWRNRGDINGFNTPGTPTAPETINTWWYAKVAYDTILLAVVENPGVQLSYDQNNLRKNDTLVCEGDLVPFFIYNDGQDHYDGDKYNYEWFFNSSPSESNTDQIAKIILDSSFVVIKATNKSNSACVSYDTLKISTVPPVTIEADILDPLCDESMGSVEVTILTSPPNPEFTWAGFPVNTSNIINNISTGTYNLHIEDPGFPGRCALDTFFTISGGSGIDIINLITSPSLCYNNTGSATVVMADPSGTYEYSWNNGQPISSSSISHLPAGSHSVVVTEPSSGCSDDTAFTIGELPLRIAATKQDIFCDNPTGAIRLTSPSDISGLSIYWNGIEENIRSKESLGAGVYHLQVESPINPGCNADTTLTIDNISYTVIADFTYRSLGYQQRLETQTDFQFTNTTPGNIVYSSWDFGDGNYSEEKNPIHRFYQEGKQEITLTVKDQNGCSGIARRTIGLTEKLPCGIAFPNAFSPNGDTQNDDIGILGHAEKVDLKIFNRWGELIFRAEELKKKWDGNYREGEAPIGVYPFVLDWECPDENGVLRKYQRVGDVTLIR